MSKNINLNLFAVSLIGKLIEIKIESSVNSPKLRGSLAQKDLYQLPNPIYDANNPYTLAKGNDEIYAITSDRQIGFGKDEYQSFSFLIDNVWALNKHNVSKNLILGICFKWIITSKINAQIGQDFLIYIQNELAKVIKDYEISFQILNLEIEKNFEIGDVKFWYATKELWSFEPKLGEEFKGKVFVSCIVKNTDEEKANELAYKKCSLAVDVLKTLYQTFSNPHIPVYFEIDRRCKYQPQGIGMITELGTNRPSIQHENQLKDENGDLKEDIIDWITHPDRDLLLNVISENINNELHKLVIDSIERFSSALSSEKLHGKIVGLITIWESLLLPNKNSSIKYTLIKYGPKLIYDSIEERRALSDLISKFYEIRSNYIHHAIDDESTINPSDTFEFQKHTLNLIIVMLHASKKYGAKIELLKKIDDEMDKAFSIISALK